MIENEKTETEINLLALAMQYNQTFYFGKKEKSKCCKSYKKGKICKRCPKHHA